MAVDSARGFHRSQAIFRKRTLRPVSGDIGLNIGPRLILGFGFIILSMLAADAVVLWQFNVVRTEAGRLNDIERKLVAVLRVHTSLLAFYDRLDAFADSEDAARLVTEAGPLLTAVLDDIGRAASAQSLPPFDLQGEPTILSTLHVIQSALPSQLEGITTLATAGDWRAVHLRLANQVRPLESLASALVEKVDREAGEQQAQTVLNIGRVQRRVFIVVPLTVVFTLVIAATVGLAITRSITQPLARLVGGSKALARGEFQHQVSVSGNDELAHLGHVFNDAARRLRDLYATLQSSEDRLRRVIDTIPAHAGSTLPDGSVDFINQRFLEFTGLSQEDLLGWGWGSAVHPDDLTRYVDQWQAAVATRESLESEARVRRADGTYSWLLIRNVPLCDEQGNIVNWYGTAIDIEERHLAEEALRRAQADLAHVNRVTTLGELTASIAHEINNRSPALSPTAAPASAGSRVSRPIWTRLAKLLGASSAMGNRANEVITRTRALMQKTETKKAQLDINDAIEEVVLLTQNEAARSDVRLRRELTAGLTPVFGDRVQLQQVILNLVMNGVEAMSSVDRPRELVIFSRRRESAQVLVAVQDCGRGGSTRRISKRFQCVLHYQV
jgi:PAS domain S-box-containing protein